MNKSAMRKEVLVRASICICILFLNYLLLGLSNKVDNLLVERFIIIVAFLTLPVFLGTFFYKKFYFRLIKEILVLKNLTRKAHKN